MKALIGTMNPGKIEGAKLALERYFENVEVEGYKASSEVDDQPVDKETLIGARNRARNTKKYAEENRIEADYFMGVESGIVNLYDHWFIANAAVVIDKNGYESIGYGPIFPVPEKYAQEVVVNGFGKVMTNLFGKEDLGQSVGGVDGLTHHAISRIDITRDAFVMALTEQVNEVWNDKPKQKIK